MCLLSLQPCSQALHVRATSHSLSASYIQSLKIEVVQFYEKAAELHSDSVCLTHLEPTLTVKFMLKFSVELTIMLKF